MKRTKSKSSNAEPATASIRDNQAQSIDGIISAPIIYNPYLPTNHQPSIVCGGVRQKVTKSDDCYPSLPLVWIKIAIWWGKISVVENHNICVGKLKVDIEAKIPCLCLGKRW